MSGRSDSLLLWSPRIVGILLCLFLSLFGLDAFGGGKTFLEGLGDFAIHVTPVLVLLGVVAVSWRWEWVGGAVFIGLGLAYSWWAAGVRRHPDWIVFIAVPLLVVGLLFLLSWRRRRRLHRVSQA